MNRYLLLAPCLFGTVYGCTSGSPSSTFAEQDKAYSACISEQTASLGAVPAAAAAPKGPFSARLDATDIAAVTRVMREGTKATMRQSLEGQRVATIATLRCESLKPVPQSNDYGGAVDASAPSSSKSASAAGSPTSPATATQASGTNNQVAGVDEADFVKNDNKYIYIVNGSHFRIIDAFPGSTMHSIADVSIKGEAKKLFVEGNRALVYSSVPRTLSSPSDASYPGGYRPYNGGNGGNTECTYGLSGCVPSGDGTETEISIFDLTDLTAPKLVRSIHSSSSLIAARRIGNAVHTVLGQASAFQGSTYWAAPISGEGASEADINAAYAKTETANEAAIDASTIDSAVLPQWTDSTNRGITTGLYSSSLPDGNALTSVLSLDLVSDADLSIASVIGRPGWVYASEDALYMAVPHEQTSAWGWYEGQDDVKELSTIHKFSVGATPGATSYVGSGIVKGRVLNELAMDEQGGFLRVATTTGHLPSPDAHNTLSIFEAKDGALVETGEIDKIAPGEDIRSVRFDGDQGYIVTFKKTDPLYVFDLKDPHAPKVQGELKIPGFSTYIHMMDPTHLLTIGFDAADQGDFAWFTGVILQIFDVSNPSAPTLMHKETIGTRGTSSEALTNHLAFTYFAPKNLLALPMTICEGGNDKGGYGTNMTFSGLMVYDATVADGFKLRGKVAHPSTFDQQNGGYANSYGYNDAACSNWWANATSEVKRSIIMDDWVYSVSDARIKSNALSSLGTDVKEVLLTDLSGLPSSH